MAKSMDAIRQCSCVEMKAHIEAGSLDAVFTDPPYPREFLSCYSELAEFAVHALRPGGLLLTMLGQVHFPEVMRRLSVDGLRYRWIVSYTYEKPRSMMHCAKVSVGWKPLLAYTRTGAHPQHYSQDTIMATPRTGNDRASHIWGQTERDMQRFVKEWMRPGWKVCDPFVGAGSLLAAAKALGCEVSGCDIDPRHVAVARTKVAQENLFGEVA